MAEEPGNDLSSYSDPIYDRLEHINKFLARNWRVLVIAVLVVVIALTSLGTMNSSSDEARSATAFNNAVGDSEKLKAVAADESILPEFRFQAANNLVQSALDDNKLEDAQQYLGVAEKHAQTTGSDKFKMLALISKGSLQSQAGERESAIRSYQEALNVGRSGKFVAATAIAQFNKAILEIEHAATLEDKEQAEILRSSAFYALDGLRGQQDLNNNRIQEGAQYAYYDLVRQFPKLVAESDLGADTVDSADNVESAEGAEPVEDKAETSAAPAE